VNFFDATIFGFTAWRVVLAAVLLLSYAGFTIWKIRSTPKRKAEAGAAGGNDFAEQVMSTLPLTDTQRIDRLHRVVSLKAGEKADLNELTFGRLKKFQVTFAGIEHSSGQEFAHIKVELGGASADYGASVKELADNDFLLPKATPDEQRCSISYMCGRADAVSFLRVKIKQIDIAQRSADIDVLHVRGRRAA